MMESRLICLAAAGLACCAGPRAEKMAWPDRPVVPRPARTPAPAQGGGLELVPAARTPVLTPAAAATTTAEPPPGIATERARLMLHWPLPATGVNSLFGVRRDPFDGTERQHNGVDLEAEYGAVIAAAADGEVAWAGWNEGHGRQVVITHAGGYQTTYSHLSQVIAITGSEVRAGQAIGRVGNSGRSTGAHLHFEVTRWGVYHDPLDVLGVPLDLR